MKIHVHRLLVLSRRSTNQLSHRLPIIDLHKLIDDHVGFELAFNLVEVIERDTGKVVSSDEDRDDLPQMRYVKR